MLKPFSIKFSRTFTHQIAIQSAFAALLLGTVSALGATKVEILGDGGYPPYSYGEGKQVKGIYIDILKKIAAKLAPEYEVVVLPVPWKRGLEEVKTGASLGLVPPYFLEDRTPWMHYSKPILAEEVVLFCNDKIMSQPHTRFPEDYKGVTVGVNAGFTMGEKFAAAKKDGSVKIEEAKDNEANIKKLAAGRIDCYANDRISVQYTLKEILKKNPNDGLLKNFKLKEAAISSVEQGHIGFSIPYSAPWKKDFMAKADKAIEAVIKEGGVQQVVQSWTK